MRSIDQILLPFAEKEYIDVPRARRILGVSTVTVLNLYQAGKIEIIDYAKCKRKRVRYQSIVDFCDELRERYGIKDRRPPLSHPMFRHADTDLLPFPLADTINVERAAQILGYETAAPVISLVLDYRFDAYHFLPNSPWRISLSSLAAYLKVVYGRARVTFQPRESLQP